jgi:hypothetical protein
LALEHEMPYLGAAQRAAHLGTAPHEPIQTAAPGRRSGHPIPQSMVIADSGLAADNLCSTLFPRTR